MKSSRFFSRILSLTALVIFTCMSAKAQSQSGNLSITQTGNTYNVIFTPTSNGAFVMGASSLVALKAPTGTITLPNTVTDVTAGPWTLTSPKQSDSVYDYWGYTTSGNTPLNFTSGTPMTLFTFPAPVPCGGTVSIVDPNNLPGGGSGVVNNFDYGTTINSPVSGNIAGVSGNGVTCSAPFAANNPPSQSAQVGSNGQGNASTELQPSGGVAPYSYLQDTGASCVAPAGATALPGSIAINSNTGAYTYAVPSTPGTYYYCIKVCDSSTTPNCVTKTYTLTVASNCNAGSVAPSVH